MLKQHTKLNHLGDTIIEVLVVLAVLGSALAISYKTASHSLLITRASQESSQATELLAGEIEGLRTLTCSNVSTGTCATAAQVFNATPYCITGIPPAYTTAASCQVNQSGATCNAATDGFCYTLSIQYSTSATNPDLFTLTATWPDASGTGPANTQTLFYRLHQ